MVATHQVIRHFLKSVGRVQTKGLVAPVALDTDTGLPLMVRQVLVVPVKQSTEQIIKVREEFRVRHGKEKLVLSHSTETEDTTGCVHMC